MNLKTVFLFTLSFISCVASFTQEKDQQQILGKRIDIHFEDASLATCLHQIDSLSGGLNLTYNQQLFNTEAIVNKSFTNKTVDHILTQVLSEYNLAYKAVEKQIIIFAKPQAKVKYVVLRGYVKDRTNNELLIGATIYFPALQQGIISNNYGFFSAQIPDTVSTALVQFLGYKQLLQRISPKGSAFINFSLEPDTSLINPVIVVAGDMLMSKQAQTGYHRIQAASINKMSSIMGEDDVIKALDLLPGIKMHADGSVNYHVRGGNRDQNMLLIDDAPVYNPSHLFGFYSSVIPGAIQSVKLFKTDIPVAYGGRLSSLVDIRIKEGNKNNFEASGSIGPISGNYSIEGPLINQNHSYFIWYRKSHIKWIAQSYFEDEVSDFGFFDFYGKTSFRLNDRNRIFTSIYTGTDSYLAAISDTSKNGLRWGNSLINIRWNSEMSQKLFVNTTLVYSEYKYQQFKNTSENTHLLSSISRANLKSDFSHYISPGLKSNFGYLLGFSSFNPGNFVSSDTNLVKEYPVIPKHFTSQQCMYWSVSTNTSKPINMDAGIRFSLWNNHGQATFFTYNENYTPTDTVLITRSDTVYNSYFNLLPRFNLRYTFNDEWALKTSYSKTIQHVHLISNTSSPFTSLDVWLPANKSIKPQLSHNITLGLVYEPENRNYSYSFEAFYRKLLNQIEYSTHAQIFLNPHLEAQLRFGETTVRGLELQASKNKGKLSGWLNFSIIRVYKHFEEINGGKEFLAVHDQPFSISLFASYQMNKRLNFSLSGLMSSGNRYSSPTDFIYYQGQQVPLFNDKNNERLGVYHRTDVSASWRLNKKEKRFSHFLKLSLYNAYANRNPFSVNFNKTKDYSGTIYVPADRTKEPALIVTESFIISWFPSLTYSFKWK